MDLAPLPNSRKTSHRNFPAHLRHWAEVQPQEVAFYFTDGEGSDQQLSYWELERRARAIAVELTDRGLVGQRALLIYPSQRLPPMTRRRQTEDPADCTDRSGAQGARVGPSCQQDLAKNASDW